MYAYWIAVSVSRSKKWSRPGVTVSAEIGDAWIAEHMSALLWVPSAIIPFEQNVLINPLHPDSARLSVADISPFTWDSRLW